MATLVYMRQAGFSQARFRIDGKDYFFRAGPSGYRQCEVDDGAADFFRSRPRKFFVGDECRGKINAGVFNSHPAEFADLFGAFIDEQPAAAAQMLRRALSAGKIPAANLQTAAQLKARADNLAVAAPQVSGEDAAGVADNKEQTGDLLNGGGGEEAEKIAKEFAEFKAKYAENNNERTLNAVRSRAEALRDLLGDNPPPDCAADYADYLPGGTRGVDGR